MATLRGCVQSRLNPAALSKSVNVPTRGRLKTSFIEQWWVYLYSQGRNARSSIVGQHWSL